MATRAEGNGEFDRLLYEDDLVAVGTFRLRVNHPRFEDSGPIRRPVFVFPRTSCVIEHEDRPPFVTDPTMVTYYNEGQAYLRRPDDPRGDLCEWFSVRHDVLRDVLAEWDPAVADRPARIFPFTHGRSDAGTYLLQRSIVRYLEADARPDPMRVQELVLEILERVLALAPWSDRVESPSPRRAADAIADMVCRILRSSFTRGLSLDDIADDLGLSVFHMCRQFRKVTGTTIHQYRTQLRLRRGLELVADHEADLTRIALRLGFSSHSHFTATFRRTFHLTPTDVRVGSVRRIAEFVPTVRTGKWDP